MLIVSASERSLSMVSVASMSVESMSAHGSLANELNVVDSVRSIGTPGLINRLYVLCDEAKENDEASWDAIRTWLTNQPESLTREGAETLGEFTSCALHLVCRNCPPVDVVKSLCTVAPQAAEWADIFGWLPLHYACANGASEQVIQILTDVCSSSMVTADKKGRTPLHFALNLNRPATPLAIELLASSGAAKLADENGMLPLHYACAYGACQEVLRTLLLAFPDSTMTRDRKRRIPLHYVLSNADRSSSPGVVNILVTLNPETTNFIDKEGGLPIHSLAIRAARKTELKVERENIIQCLKYYLGAKPYATADFLTALQSLPEWLRDVAVLTPSVQDNLNQKIAKRFPTSILMLDFYFLMLIISFFTLGVYQSLDIRWGETTQTHVSPWIIILLYICTSYFIVREIVQMMSLCSLGLFRTWLKDASNWLDILTISLLLTWTTLMKTGGGDNEIFRIGTSLSLGIFWVSTLFYVKSINIEFAVFVAGVFYVVKYLAAFLVTASVFLFAFAQIFVTIFTQTDYCVNAQEDGFFFCNLPDSFVQSLTFMLGELEDEAFTHSVTSIVFFVLFVCLICIILSTVLIAIVTDSYGIIKRERAAIVFWNNRLDFVAEMHAISNGPWKRRVMAVFSRGNIDDNQQNYADDQETFGRDLWDKVISIYDDEKLQVMSFDFWAYTTLRIFTAFFICLILFPLGLVTAGWLWPPQLREYFFVKSMVKSQLSDTQAVADNQALQDLAREAQELRDIIGMKLMSNRYHITTLKDNLKEMREEMMVELRQIRQVTLTLYERRRNRNNSYTASVSSLESRGE